MRCLTNPCHIVSKSTTLSVSVCIFDCVHAKLRCALCLRLLICWTAFGRRSCCLYWGKTKRACLRVCLPVCMFVGVCVCVCLFGWLCVCLFVCLYVYVSVVDYVCRYVVPAPRSCDCVFASSIYLKLSMRRRLLFSIPLYNWRRDYVSLYTSACLIVCLYVCL